MGWVQPWVVGSALFAEGFGQRCSGGDERCCCCLGGHGRPVDGHGVSFQECAGGVAMKGLCCACLPGGGRASLPKRLVQAFLPLSPTLSRKGRGKTAVNPYLYCVRRY